MIELLEMCGFTAAEAGKELPRFRQVFDRLGINEEDINRGKKRLAEYYDIELAAVRKIFRFCLREMADSVMAREDGKEKVIFGFMAPIFDVIGAAAMARSRDVYAAHQCWAYLMTVGSIFGKTVKVLETAEQSWLKSGAVTHCGNVKTLLGLLESSLLPRPDLLVSTGFSCETAPKTLDLLQEVYDIPVHCFDSCQDRELVEYDQASKRMIELAARSLRTFTSRVGELVGFPITDNMLREVLDVKKEFNLAMDRLHFLIENSDPLLLGPAHQSLLMAFGSLTIRLEEIPEATVVLNDLIKDLENRAGKGEGVVAGGAPRILTILPMHHADPRLEHLVEEMGLALVATDFGFNIPYEGDTGDPYIEMSVHLMGSMASCLPRRIPLIIENCRRLKIDGVLNTYHVGCRTVAGDALMIGEAIGKELGIPVLNLEWESFDPRVFDKDSYTWQLETFKTLLNYRL